MNLEDMDATYKALQVKLFLPFFSFSFVWLTKDDERLVKLLI
jgi:hypothetical protein